MSRKKSKRKSSNEDAKDIIKGAMASLLASGVLKAIEFIIAHK